MTTKTKPVRTAVKSVTASTTARKSRISRPASSAVSAVKLDTWLAIVPIAKLANRGATTTVSAASASHPVLVVLPKTNSTPSFPKWEVLVANPVVLSNTTATAAATELQAAITLVEESAVSSPGSVARLAVLHLGPVMIAMIVVVATTTLLLHRLGLVVAAVVANHMAKTMVMVVVTTPLLGHLLLQLRPLVVQATDMAVTAMIRMLQE